MAMKTAFFFKILLNICLIQITDVSFGGKLAPDSSGMSDNEKIWLAVGITLAILLAVLLIYLVSNKVDDFFVFRSKIIYIFNAVAKNATLSDRNRITRI
jgi:hypothetical protein